MCKSYRPTLYNVHDQVVHDVLLIELLLPPMRPWGFACDQAGRGVEDTVVLHAAGSASNATRSSSYSDSRADDLNGSAVV